MNMIRGHHRDMTKTALAAIQGLLDYDQRVRDGKHTNDAIETFPADEGLRKEQAESMRDYLQGLIDAQV